MIRRREFITVLGGAGSWPLAARAQQCAIPVIGFLSSTSVSGPGSLAFQKGLSRAGYVAGQNVIIEIRKAEGRYDQLPALAADFVRRKANVIVAAGGLVSARAAIARQPLFPSSSSPALIR